MKNLIAKFKIGSVTDFGNNNHEVKMTPVVSGSEENKAFSLYTPSGDCRLHITNPNAVGFFKVSEDYYLRFTPVNERESVSVHNNSDAFRSFLDENSLEWKPNEHSTIIYGQVDLFTLGARYEKYAMKNNPNYKI